MTLGRLLPTPTTTTTAAAYVSTSSSHPVLVSIQLLLDLQLHNVAIQLSFLQRRDAAQLIVVGAIPTTDVDSQDTLPPLFGENDKQSLDETAKNFIDHKPKEDGSD